MTATDPVRPGGAEPDPPTRPPDELVWHRMHPITPLLKAWQAVLALAVFTAMQFSADEAAGAGGPGLAAAGAVLAVGGVAVGGYSVVAWRLTRYAVDAEHVHLVSGVVFRRNRQARLDRIQAVDVVQPLLARLFGLARLVIEQAGGQGSRVELAYLTEGRAREVRNELLARAAGLAFGGPSAAAGPAAGQPGEPPPGEPVPDEPVPGEDGPRRAVAVGAPEAPEQEVYSVPTPRLLASVVLSGPMASVLFVVALLIGASVALGFRGGLGLLLPGLLAVGGVLWSRFAGEFAFRAAISQDGIRLRHGLTEARAQTVPPGRVQALRLEQPLLWRGPDWWRVRVNVAGYADDQDAGAGTVLLPVGTRAEAFLAVWLVLPDVWGDPALAAALTGRGEEGGFTASPRRARWLDPVGWHRNGLAVTERALLLRRGRLDRQVDLVPHERTQSLGLRQGPLQRALGLATFVAHSTPGPVDPVAAHLEAGVAVEKVLEQAHRARLARAAAPPEHWLRGTREPGPDQAGG